MNQSLRLRCVCCYTFTQWINLVVCLLDYEWLSGEMNLPLRLRNVRWYYAMNKPCGVFVGLWMIVGRDESAPAVCRWYYALNKPCGVFVGLWMMYGRDKSAPTPTVCSLLYIYALNKPCGVFDGLWMMYGRDKSAPTPTVCRWYYALNKSCGVFADITQWMSLAVCLLNILWTNMCNI